VTGVVISSSAACFVSRFATTDSWFLHHYRPCHDSGCWLLHHYKGGRTKRRITGNTVGHDNISNPRESQSVSYSCTFVKEGGFCRQRLLQCKCSQDKYHENSSSTHQGVPCIRTDILAKLTVASSSALGAPS
jgi:hypothetical protein